MNRIHSVLSSRPAARSRDLPLAVVNQWIGDLREIPYGFSKEWKTPAETEAEPVADCKAKAVALYQKMQANGAEHVRLVIGRRTTWSRRTHAWLEWATNTGTYLLDPTFNWAACRADHFRNRAYFPLYAYSGTSKFRAYPAPLVAVN